jgi:hypothetical protein
METLRRQLAGSRKRLYTFAAATGNAPRAVAQYGEILAIRH